MFSRDAMPAEGVIISLPPHVGPRDADLRPPQSPHLFRRTDADQTRVCALHRHDWRVDLGQHADQPCGDSERVPGAKRICSIGLPGAPARAGSRPWLRPACEQVVLTVPEAENQVSLLGEKLTVERADGTATLLLGWPADRHRQQRDD